MKKKIIALTAVMAVTVSGAAVAAVTFDATTGTGFVGKGDVQTPAGLNNSQMQKVHQGVTFAYIASDTYEFECEWYTGPVHNRKHHTTTIQSVSNINSQVTGTSRQTGQFTGWNLTGPAPTGGQAAQPTDADCGAEGNEMKSVVPGSVELVSSTGGLYANVPGVGAKAAQTVGPLN